MDLRKREKLRNSPRDKAVKLISIFSLISFLLRGDFKWKKRPFLSR